MKPILLFFKGIIFIISLMTNAQTTDLVTGISSPFSFVLNGNELYYSVFTENKISKVNDITQLSPTTEDVVTGLNGPFGIALDGNELFIVERSSNKVSKIDITDAVPTPVDVVTGLGDPAGILMNGTDMYISEINTNKITKVDLSTGIPLATDFITVGLEGPVGMVLKGNDLYIAERDGDVVSKADLTLPVLIDVVSSGILGPEGLALSASGNDLYISERDGNRISTIDPSLPTPISASGVINTTTGPADIVLNGSIIYIGEFNKITTSDISTLAVNNTTLAAVNSFPNPFTDQLTIQGNIKANERYILFDILGKRIRSGIINTENTIQLDDLNSGIYFIKIGNTTPLKIVKK
jgi:hypothetical protein